MVCVESGVWKSAVHEIMCARREREGDSKPWFKKEMVDVEAVRVGRKKIQKTMFDGCLVGEREGIKIFLRRNHGGCGGRV